MLVQLAQILLKLLNQTPLSYHGSAYRQLIVKPSTNCQAVIGQAGSSKPSLLEGTGLHKIVENDHAI